VFWVIGLAIIMVIIMSLYIMYIVVIVNPKCILKGGNCGIVAKRIDVREIPLMALTCTMPGCTLQ
jgi:hypothetical protein